jgi:transposase
MRKQPSKPNTSVYRKQSVEVRTIFEKASSPRKVLCVALDYAKQKHVALFCDGLGDILKKPFTVENNPAGIDFLCKEIQATCRRRKINKETIFLGGEDEPSYITNFVTALSKKGYLVVRVNAREAAKYRENMLASTDNLDLLGISKCLLNRRASPVSSADKQEPIYKELRELTRQRRIFVRQQTAASNRIHAIADQLFPGFLNHALSGITPFSSASLHLMKDRFSTNQFCRRKQTSLAKTLQLQGIHKADEKAYKIIELAKNALPPNPDKINSLQQNLQGLVQLYQCLQTNAKNLRETSAGLLAQTPYIMLTTIPGISFVLASGLASELGDPKHIPPTNSLCSYAGIVPAVIQSGGPDSAPIHTSTHARCNHILKDWIVQGSQKIGLCGPPELKAKFAQRNANGQHAAYAGARTLLRITRNLVTSETPYLSPDARCNHATQAQRTQGYLHMWKKLITKWKTIPNWQQILSDENHPIGFWRRVIKELHDIELPLRHEPSKDS